MEENTTKEVLSAVSSNYDNVKRYYDAKCKTYTIRVFKAEGRLYPIRLKIGIKAFIHVYRVITKTSLV